MERKTFRETQYGFVLDAVASRLDNGEPFTLADLIAATWRTAPERFALAGYPDLPDGHKVRCCVCGPRSLVALGYLDRVGASRFKLTECGRQKARGVDVPPAEPVLTLPKLLEAAKSSAAYHLYDTGHAAAVTFSDARRFWSAESRQANVAECVKALGALLADRDTAELRSLGACHDWLAGRFARHIQLASAEARRVTA